MNTEKTYRNVRRRRTLLRRRQRKPQVSAPVSTPKTATALTNPYYYWPPVFGNGTGRPPTDIDTHHGFGLTAPYIVPVTSEVFSTIQDHYTEKTDIKNAGVPSSYIQFGSQEPGGGDTLLQKRLAIQNGTGILFVNNAVAGPATLFITFGGGFGADASALMYFVFDSNRQILNGGRPILVFPNSQMNSANLPNPVRSNCDSHGTWTSNDPQPAVRVPLIRDVVSTSQVGTYEVINGLTGGNTNSFQAFDAIIFVLVNYGRSFSGISDLSNRRWSYTTGVGTFLGLPENTDTVANVPDGSGYTTNNSHFSGVSLYAEFPPPISAAIGAEDRPFASADNDFQDHIFFLDSNEVG